MRPAIFYDGEHGDRRVAAETYVGSHRHPGIKLQLKSGPRGDWSIMYLRLEEFDALVTAYLRYHHVEADG